MGAKAISDKDREKIKTLWAKGLSAGVIAASMGRSRNSVIGFVSRMKLPSRPTGVAAPRYNWPNRKPHIKPTPSPKPPATIPASSDPIAIGPLNTFPDTNSCRYIAADVAAGDWRCCGLPIDRHSLCRHHASRCRVTPATRVR